MAKPILTIDERKLEKIKQRRAAQRKRRVPLVCFGCGAFEGKYVKPNDPELQSWQCQQCLGSGKRATEKEMNKRLTYYNEHADELQARDAECRLCGEVPCKCPPCARCGAGSYALCSCGNYSGARRRSTRTNNIEPDPELPDHIMTGEEQLKVARRKDEAEIGNLKDRLTGERGPEVKSLGKLQPVIPMPPIPEDLDVELDPLYVLDAYQRPALLEHPDPTLAPQHYQGIKGKLPRRQKENY